MSTVWTHKPETNGATSPRPGIHLGGHRPIPGRRGALGSTVDEVVEKPLTPADVAVFAALASAALDGRAGTTGSLMVIGPVWGDGFVD